MEELMKETKAGQTAPASETGPKKKFGFPKSKKAKKWMKLAVAAVVIAALAAGCVARASKKANAYLSGSYLVDQAARRDLALSVTGTATHFVLKRYKSDGVIFEGSNQDKRLVVTA